MNYFIDNLKYFKAKMLGLIVSDRVYISNIYKKITGNKLDLNEPKTFNEKIQWLKLNDRNPLYIKLSDKVEVRDYVKKKVSRDILIRQIRVYSSVNNIKWEDLPEQFVLKAAHGSGWNIICENKNELNWNEMLRKLSYWLNRNYYFYGREWNYRDVPKKIVCEEFLNSDDGNDLLDYKIFCFNGKPTYIQVDIDRFSDHKRNFYSPEWKSLNFSVLYNQFLNKIEKPLTLNKMLEVATLLSEGIPFVRVDLYSVKNKVYFGEMTFYPGNGLEPFYPAEVNIEFGNKLDIERLNAKEK